MTFFKRSLLPIAIASLLPTLIFAAIALYLLYKDDRNRIEDAATDRARAVMSEVDAQLRADLNALTILTTSPSIDQADWANYTMRLNRLGALNPNWLAISLYDGQSGAPVFDIHFSGARAAPAAGTAAKMAALRKNRPVFEAFPESFARVNEPAVSIHMPVPREAGARYVLTLTLSTRIFQDILLTRIHTSTVAGIVDEHGLFLARNPSYETRVGTPATSYVRDAVASREPHGFYHAVTWEGWENYTAYYRSGLTGWSAHIAVASGLIDKRRSWSLLGVCAAALASLALGGLLVAIVARDLADRQRADETLRQAQKMEAVGQLTGGIAHDFNNLLTAIIGNLDLLSARLGQDEKLKRRADNALEAAHRAAKLTAQLLAFSRTRNIVLAAIDLRQLTESLRDLLAHSVGPTIKLDIKLDEEARFVLCDANQLELALINLAVNARDAMPAGGTLTITTGAYEARAADALPPGAYVEICIADTGFGMNEEVKARALEPFFTTKPVGKGTGLGLSQVFGIMRQSGGTVKIDSTPGQGTRIRLVLPVPPLAMPLQTETAGPAPAAAAPAPHAPALVLVVDDEAALRDLMCEALSAADYRCEACAASSEALKIIAARPVDLLVTDFAMPDMNGADLAREARRVRAGLKVLFVSGYADAEAIESAITQAPMLRKPFNAQELVHMVTRVLEGETQSA